MGRAGIFLTRKQILYIQRLLIIEPPKPSPEMDDLVEEVNKAAHLVKRSTELGWGEYEWTESDDHKASTNGKA